MTVTVTVTVTAIISLIFIQCINVYVYLVWAGEKKLPPLLKFAAPFAAPISITVLFFY